MSQNNSELDDIMNIYNAIFHPKMSRYAFVYFDKLKEYYQTGDHITKERAAEAIFKMLNNEYGIYRELKAMDNDFLWMREYESKSNFESQIEKKKGAIKEILDWLETNIAESTVPKNIKSRFSIFYETYNYQFKQLDYIKDTLKNIKQQLT